MLNYEIVPGQRLVFVDLAEQLNVSRTPVNNALAILAKEGYLDFVPNQGYSVHKMTRKEAENLYDIRDVLEMGFIGRAIRQMDELKLENLEQKKFVYESNVARHVTRELFILDTDFHLAILEMAENELLNERYKNICRKIFLRFRTEDLYFERILKIREEHHDLFEAICHRDVESAKEQIRMHHQRSRESLFPVIFSEQPN